MHLVKAAKASPHAKSYNLGIGCGTPKLCQNNSLLSIFSAIKKTGTLDLAAQKSNFLGVHLEQCPGGGTPKLCQNVCLLNTY